MRLWNWINRNRYEAGRGEFVTMIQGRERKLFDKQCERIYVQDKLPAWKTNVNKLSQSEAFAAENRENQEKKGL